ncbi:MAG TPA: vWA domain-containing protein, partial [Kofleriaceae bacterium]|nr:vWA domain-containing protein [Kofleriaceae bacterium]
MRFAWGVTIAALLAIASPARADDTKPSYRTIIDRADLERASIGGQRLRVYVSGLALQGQIMDVSDPKSLKLFIGSAEKKVPYTLGTYASTTSDTAVVICIQASQPFADVLRAISDAIDTTLLADLNEHTQVAILMYGDTVSAGKLASAKATRGKLSVITTDASSTEPMLLDGLDRALSMLKKVKSDPAGRAYRKMIVVIGDGRDLANDHERVTKTGKRALKDGVRIHSLAYSPNDARRTLLVLGELSKQSLGTFRWICG